MIELIEGLDPVKKAICLYLADNIQDCLEICSKHRQIYLRLRKENRKDKNLDSYAMVKIYIIQLSCLVEILRQDHLSKPQRQAYKK